MSEFWVATAMLAVMTVSSAVQSWEGCDCAALTAVPMNAMSGGSEFQVLCFGSFSATATKKIIEMSAMMLDDGMFTGCGGGGYIVITDD